MELYSEYPLVDMWWPAMLKLSARTGPLSRRSISSEDLLMNIDGIVFTSRRWALVQVNQVGEGGVDQTPPVVCVNEYVEAEDVVVVVEAADILLHDCVNLLVAAQDGFDDDVLDSIPKRFWVFTPLPHPSPQLID